MACHSHLSIGVFWVELFGITINLGASCFELAEKPWGELSYIMARVVLDDGVNCLGPSFNRGELSLIRVVLISYR